MPFETTSIARLQHDRLEMTVTFSNEGAMATLADEPPDAVGSPSFDNLKPLFLKHATSLYTVFSGGKNLAVDRADIKLKPGGEVEFILIYPNPGNGLLRFKADYLQKLTPGFSGTLTVFDAAETQLGSKILFAGSNTLELTLSPPEKPQSKAMESPQQQVPVPASYAFLELGVKNGLAGYTHLLFLCGLLVVCRDFRSMLALAMLFTVAHSLTLALAAYNLATLPGRVEDSLLGASIIFAGVANLIYNKTGIGRSLAAFGFGLIHGFNFARALDGFGIGTGQANSFLHLLSFNLGIEIGQVTVVSILMALVVYLRSKAPIFNRYGSQAISAGVLLGGGCWLLQGHQ